MYNHLMELATDRAYLLHNFQDLRIVQPTVVFIHGLPKTLASEQTLEQQLWLLGPIRRIKIKFLSKDFFSAFVELQSQGSAALLILMLEGVWLQRRSLRVFFGCTKFCPHFLKGHVCHLQECNYAHYYYPHLTHHKDNVKSIDHSQVASLLLNSHSSQLNPFISYLLEHSGESALLSLGVPQLQNLLSQRMYGGPYQQEQMGMVCCESQEGSTCAESLREAEKQNGFGVTLQSRQSKGEKEWAEIEREIGSESGDCEQEEGRSARIQEFLDGAERLLTKLIFQSSVFVY